MLVHLACGEADCCREGGVIGTDHPAPVRRLNRDAGGMGSIPVVKNRHGNRFLSHRDVEFAFDLVRNLGFKVPDDVAKLNLMMKELQKMGRLPIIDDYNVLVMYSEVIQAKKDLIERRGNWAQPFFTDRDGQIFVTAQFLRHTQAIEEVKNGPLSALKQISAKGGKKP